MAKLSKKERAEMIAAAMKTISQQKGLSPKPASAAWKYSSRPILNTPIPTDEKGCPRLCRIMEVNRRQGRELDVQPLQAVTRR